MRAELVAGDDQRHPICISIGLSYSYVPLLVPNYRYTKAAEALSVSMPGRRASIPVR